MGPESIQKLSELGPIVMLLLVGIGWLVSERAELRKELKEEKLKREMLETSHSQAVLGLGLKSAKAMDRVADVLQRKR